jgi:hypothetical protein
MKKTLGYGVKFSNEDMDTAYKVYWLTGLYGSKKEARVQLQKYKKEGKVLKNETVSIFKVVMEVLS